MFIVWGRKFWKKSSFDLPQGYTFDTLAVSNPPYLYFHHSFHVLYLIVYHTSRIFLFKILAHLIDLYILSIYSLGLNRYTQPHFSWKIRNAYIIMSNFIKLCCIPFYFLYIDYVKTILHMKTFLPNQENSKNESNAMPGSKRSCHESDWPWHQN